jgi:ribonuclease HII
MTQYKSSKLCLLEEQLQKIQREEILKLEAAVEIGFKKKAVPVRPSVERAALVIGCDEVGMGPLAGPVVGAAFCRIPKMCFRKKFNSQRLRAEPFSVNDSKQLSSQERQQVFENITGHPNIFEAMKNCAIYVHEFDDRGNPKISFSDAHTVDPAELSLPTTAHHISVVGQHCGRLYRHFWCVSIGSIDMINQRNILQASMDCMHSSAVGVWSLLSRRPGGGRGQPLANRLKALYASESKKDPDPVEEKTGYAKDIFEGNSTCQPPLLVVDGSRVPVASLEFFTDSAINGNVHPIVKGDTRSYSIAAASNLAKVTRDDIMAATDLRFPGYGFGEHKGYPTDGHRAAIGELGLCPAHRLSRKTDVTANLS